MLYFRLKHHASYMPGNLEAFITCADLLFPIPPPSPTGKVIQSLSLPFPESWLQHWHPLTYLSSLESCLSRLQGMIFFCPTFHYTCSYVFTDYSFNPPCQSYILPSTMDLRHHSEHIGKISLWTSCCFCKVSTHFYVKYELPFFPEQISAQMHSYSMGSYCKSTRPPHNP